MKILLLILTTFLVAGAARAGVTTTWMARTDPAVLAATAGGDSTEFLVVLGEQVDLRGADALREKTARGRYVYETATAFAARTQAPLRALLDARGATYRAYWIHNMLWVRGDRALVQSLATRPEVHHIYANTAHRAAPPPTPGMMTARAATTVEWNISLVNAPQVWAAGVTGQGAVVGGQDTGYDWQHEALKAQYRGWDGHAADHDYNWHDAIHANDPHTLPGNECGFDSPQPCDDTDHGTHTMGTIVGGTDEDQIGMAPGAKWIGCRNMEQGWGTAATYAECYEWFVAPYPSGGDPFSDGDPSKAPHVINNSWSCPPVEGCTTADVLRDVVEAVRAAGILSVHSAGNSGPKCRTIDMPAATYNASFTVGATNAEDEIATFSSRGPTPDGRIGPDISAPGEDIRSSVPGNRYAQMGGTSMAAPHVAGLAALLISAEPALAGQVDDLEALITSTAVSLTSWQGCGNDTPASVPNNTYGWGRIDALAAFEALQPPAAPPFSIFVPALSAP